MIREVEVPDSVAGTLYADGALFAWADGAGQASNTVARIDIHTGRVTATAHLTAAGAAFADHLLWLAAPKDVVALDPATLAVVHRLRIPAPSPTLNGSGQGTIAAAGGLIWVVGRGRLYGVDPATAAIVRHIPTPSPPPTGGHEVGPYYQIDIAAPAGGSALWSAESPDAGGYDGLQVRNPRSGAVVRSSTTSVFSIGSTEIAATDTYAWAAYATGMMGSYVQVRDQPGLPAISPHPKVHGTNAISVSLAADRLWVYDPESGYTACAVPVNGDILREARLPMQVSPGRSTSVSDITALPDGRMAVASLSTSGTTIIAVAEPRPACRS